MACGSTSNRTSSPVSVPRVAGAGQPVSTKPRTASSRNRQEHGQLSGTVHRRLRLEHDDAPLPGLERRQFAAAAGKRNRRPAPCVFQQTARLRLLDGAPRAMTAA